MTDAKTVFLAVDEILAKGKADFDSFVSCKSLFEQAIDQRLYLAAMHNMLRANIDGKLEITPDLSAGNFLVLHGSPYASWAVLKHGNRTNQLYLTPAHSMSAWVGGGQLELGRYKVPAGIDLSLLDDEKRISFAGAQPMLSKQAVAKNASVEIFDIYPVERTAGYTVRINTIPHGSFEWAYSRDTLRPQKLSSLRAADSNLTTIFELLAAVRSPESEEALAPYTEHRLHYIRWQAVKTVGAINPQRGLALAEKAASDPHPHVRAAAKVTLENVRTAAERH